MEDGAPPPDKKNTERDRQMTSARRAGRRRRELQFAKTVLRQYGETAGSRITLLSARSYKTLFRVESPSHGGFTLHSHRNGAVDEVALHSPEGLLSRQGRVTEAALRSQLFWMSAQRREAGVLAPEPIPTLEGTPTSCVRGGNDRRLRRCYLLRWVPGRNKIEDLGLSDLRLVGWYMARLHSHAEEFSVPDGFLRPERGWEYVFGDSAPLWDKGKGFYPSDDMEVFRAAAERVESHLRPMEKSSEVFGMIHGDLHRKNLVFHEDSSGKQTVCAIDFDHCGWGYYLYDLAVTLRYLQGYGERAAPMRAALMEGYQRERPLRGGREHLAACQVLRLVELVNTALTRKEGTGLAGKKGGLFYKNLVDAPPKLREFLNGTLAAV